MSAPTFTQGQLLTAAELTALIASVAPLDPATGKLALAAVPDATNLSITAAQETANSALTEAQAAAAAAQAASTAAAAAQAAATSGASTRPWVVFAGNVAPTGTNCQLLASFGVDHVIHTAAGLYQVFLDAAYPLPADIQISGGDALPAWGVEVSGYIGTLASGSDDTVILGGLNRQPTKPWGTDGTSGLSFIEIRTTYQGQQLGSTTGVDWDAIFVRLFW